MEKFICVWKPIGLTPLEVVDQLKEKSEFKNKKISYAGRLDPMAEGILILLIDDENKKRDKYLKLRKKYESEIILGISTDSYDGLGLIENLSLLSIQKDMVENLLGAFIGRRKQKYPVYSSKAVNGKSLFWWARNKKLNEIEIPEKEIQIFDIQLLSFEKIKSQDISKTLLKNIKKIKGDFRQNEIIENWKKFEKEYKDNYFVKIKINIDCSSGAYVRAVANELGELLKCGAFAYSIKRINIGNNKIENCYPLLPR